MKQLIPWKSVEFLSEFCWALPTSFFDTFTFYLMDLRVAAEICVRRRHVLAHVRRRRSVRDVQVRKKGRKTRNPNFFRNLVDIFINDVFLYVFEVCVKSTLCI